MCAACRLPVRACWCADLVAPHPVRVPVAIVRHWRERLKSSNSVRAIVAAITPVTVYDRGAPDTPFLWSAAPGDALLWPGDDGVRADPAAVARLVVVDGTWKQARKALHHVEGLVHLPRLSLPPRLPTVRRLRRPPTEEAMSTAEAVAHALRVFGDESGAEHIEAVFDRQYLAVAQLRGWERSERGPAA